jgi:hypothetical protein
VQCGYHTVTISVAAGERATPEFLPPTVVEAHILNRYELLSIPHV